MTTFSGSLLALGSCIAGAGILMAGLLALLFRHPNAPRWTRPEIVAMLLCVPLTAMIGFGLGYVVYGLSQLVHGDGDPRGLLVLAAVLIALAAAWRGLRVRQRLKDYAAAGNGASGGSPLAEPMLATGEKPPPAPAAGLPTKMA
jgi:heme A synthase